VLQRFLTFLFAFALLCALLSVSARAQTADATRYEGRRVGAVEVALEGAPRNTEIEAELLPLLRVAAGSEFSLVRARESLAALFGSGRVSNARVEIVEASGVAPVTVRFLVQPQPRVAEVIVDLDTAGADANAAGLISEDELRARLNLLQPGARVTEQTLRNNADLIQAYLRDRGFYRAAVEYSQQLDATGTRSTVTYRVRPGEQARVEVFNIRIDGFNDEAVRPELNLQRESAFTIAALGEDVNRIRQAIIAGGNLAPTLNDAPFQFNPETNRVTINLAGAVGPRVEVTVEGYELSDRRERELLPVRREGTIDLAAIEEGERRLRTRLQEDGYFFAEVSASCTVTPPLPNDVTVPAGGQSPSSSSGLQIAGAGSGGCEVLVPEELSGRAVRITYTVAPGRRFRLTDIRIEGTNRITTDDPDLELRSREATALGIIPLLGYGRGYTSLDLLERDRRTIEERMRREFGYRRAVVEVRQGVSLNGEDLIITFAVTEGPLTRVAGTEVRGNQIYTQARLREEMQTVANAPFQQSEARRDGERILNLYARNGYVAADVRFDLVELPAKDGDEQVRLIYTISEGGKVFVNRVVINGNVITQRSAILRALSIREGDVLRADRITESERALYETGAFRQVLIRTEDAGVTASGFQKRDLIIDVEEVAPRVADYIFGFSTDNGPLGGVELRDTNLFGRLRQGSVRARASRRQQLLQLRFYDPRFRSYGDNAETDTPRRFMPLTISAQYQRDTGVTRFFRSTVDRGNLGIVQRLDEEGNPVNIFGEAAGDPSINRFTFNIETQRIFEQDFDRQGRVTESSVLFLRYNYEDVRLTNIGSLLIEEILRPDRTVRLSRLGATFVRDTRNGQVNATTGDFLTLDYALALRQLGGNISFNKFQGTYRRYYPLDNLRQGTVLAGSAIVGLAHLFNARDRNDNGIIDETDRSLPISERFFSGGATSLRGFDFEEAGPRFVVVPQGQFFDDEGEPVTLTPFTVPIGGNALVALNLEARIPLTRNLQIVPFYDGGNVFNRVGDIFRRQPSADDFLNSRDIEAINGRNLQVGFTHTVGVGLRFRTPLGPVGIDYGFLLNPPEFVVPQRPEDALPNTIFRLPRSQFHIRFGQAF
jgi:outer membrane protein insertion porin family